MDKFKSLKQVLEENTVNSNNKYKVLNTVNSNENLVNKISSFIEEQNIEPEGIALVLSELLNDKRSLPYYLLLVKEHNPSKLLDLAYQVKERGKLGLIRTRMPIYFIGILRKLGFKTKFRE